MGLQQSKNVDAFEAVARCRERKQFMGAAVAARNALAAAHAAYAVALRNTGGALSDYAHYPDHNYGHDRDVLVPRYDSSAATTAASSSSAAAVAMAMAMVQPTETVLPPPPPLPDVPTQLQRAATMPRKKEKEKEAIAADAATGEEEYDDDHNSDQDDDDDDDDDEENSERRNYETASDSVLLKQPTPLPRPQMAASTAHAKGTETSDYYFFDSQPTWPDRHKEDLEDRFSAGPLSQRGKQPSLMSEKTVAESLKKSKKIVLKTEKGKKIVSATATMTVTAMAAAAAAAANSVQVLIKVDDYFLKASLGAHDVPKMLEATRMYYHSNFVDSQGHIDHSASIMRVITWNRSFKGLPQQDDADDNFDTEESETHATVLDKMLAWEKKLYDEAKEGELMKIEYHRKLALLNQRRKRGVRSEVLERSKSAVIHMQTRCSVDRESMNSTVAEINRLRDRQLYPKLVDLVDGMAKMWAVVMFEHHQSQLRAITECRAFDFALAPRETSEQHRQRTAQLRDSARGWHSSFEGLFAHQKDYIRSLNSWLSLNLVPIENGREEKDSSLSREADLPINILLQVWHQYLDKLPHDLAKNAVHGFAEAISAMLALQDDELKQKSECEDVRKDLARKRWQFEDWHCKFTQRRGALPALEGAESANQAAAVVERRIIVEAAEMKLKEAEENHKKLCKQVRERSIGSLRTHLPELFRAMSDFAFASCQMYKRLWSITQFKGQLKER